MAKGRGQTTAQHGLKRGYTIILKEEKAGPLQMGQRTDTGDDEGVVLLDKPRDAEHCPQQARWRQGKKTISRGLIWQITHRSSVGAEEEGVVDSEEESEVTVIADLFTAAEEEEEREGVRADVEAEAAAAASEPGGAACSAESEETSESGEQGGLEAESGGD